jgi:hypothetical protein
MAANLSLNLYIPVVLKPEPEELSVRLIKMQIAELYYQSF